MEDEFVQDLLSQVTNFCFTGLFEMKNRFSLCNSEIKGLS